MLALVIRNYLTIFPESSTLLLNQPTRNLFNLIQGRNNECKMEEIFL